MVTSIPSRRSVGRPAAGLALAMIVTSLACRGGPGGPPGGFPPAPVEVVTLEPKPVEQATEYVGTVKSRNSITIQPMVEGFVTRIAKRSGDRVRPGEVLVEIDPSRQRAAAAAIESLRAAREADLAFARQQEARQKALYDAGAASLQELEQAQTALSTAEAQLRAVDEQIREQNVRLGYHRVTAPAAGIVGDVPVRVGDRVDPSTVLTTLDAGAELELYVYVPVQQAAQLAVGMPVDILTDDGGVIARTAVAFVSPQVDDRTQSVLVKAPLTADSGLRTEQFVRARVVWREEPGLTVPLVAVSRINGSHFGFVAESADGGTVARQRALRLGPIVGNDYVVVSGLSAGEQLIVSGVQKIRDGAPIAPRPAGSAAAPPAPGAPQG